MPPPRPDMIVPVHENTDVAAARRAATSLALKAGFTEHDAGTVAVIATEAASNLLKHGTGGDLILRDVSLAAAPRLEILAIDSGQGMHNPIRCFEDGYSTAGSQGTGLGAIARASRLHDVYSVVGKGTVLLSSAGSRAPDPSSEQMAAAALIGAINIPYLGEEVSGDSWASAVIAGRTRILVADGLGHGVHAAQASQAAISIVDNARLNQPAEVVDEANQRLRSTRGAAVAVAEIDFRAGRVLFAGLGNVSAAIVSPAGVKRQLISMNGTAGHESVKARRFEYPFEHGSLLILHSDGLSASWSFEKYPGLFPRHPTVIAGVLYRDFRRTRDDATIVVARGARV